MDKISSHWNNTIAYLLSIIGFVIGLGNFWLFPTTCYRNGGAVFLIPYTIFLLIFGIPIVYLELLLGQVLQRANLGVFEELCPWLKGAAYSVIIMNFIRQTYYNTVIAWALYLLFASFSISLPWANDVNIYNKSIIANTTIDLNQAYFRKTVLGKINSDGIHNLAGMHTSLIPCLIIVFVVVYLIIRQGATSIGKSVYVTAIMPYVLLFVLLIKSATLKGARLGMLELFKPNYSVLLKMRTWEQAATQICYSLGPGAGVLIAYASYSNNAEMNIKFYAIIVVLCNAITSVICGIVLFCGLGYFSNLSSLPFTDFMDYGYTIIFIIYPMIIAQFKYGFLFSIAFFSMIFMIGLNSVYAEIEGMYAALCDRFIFFRSKQERNKVIILFICFVASLPTVTFGGEYIVSFLLAYGITPAVLIVIAAESIAATWYYGYDRLISKVHEYSDKNCPGIIMKWCWKIVVPLLCLILYITSYIQGNDDDTLYGPVDVTHKANIAGKVFSVLILTPIPLYAIFYFTRKLYIQRKNKSVRDKV